MSDSPTFLTPKAVAERFGITAAQVSRLADQGKIPFQLTPGGSRRFRSKDIDELERELADRAAS